MEYKAEVKEEGVESEYSEVKALEQHPYIDEEGNEWEDRIAFYSEDGRRILCKETGEIYFEKVVELYPCHRNYILIDDEPKQEEEEFSEENS